MAEASHRLPISPHEGRIRSQWGETDLVQRDVVDLEVIHEEGDAEDGITHISRMLPKLEEAVVRSIRVRH